MCPGGYVIAGSSHRNQVVTNGMSYFKRNSGIANSAVIATVGPADWGHTALGGVQLQEKLESQAFIMGKGGYRAPAQMMNDFIKHQATTDLEGSLATYRPGISPANLWELLPEPVALVMQKGILHWGEVMKGFIHEQAVLTAVETRTSAPVRIERGEDFCSVSAAGLYPCGEGAGYAGGIVSSAVDGLKTAEHIIRKYNQPGGRLEINDIDAWQAGALQ
jgi:uncharacterized FAD-dependent dehydrogenase